MPNSLRLPFFDNNGSFESASNKSSVVTTYVLFVNYVVTSEWYYFYGHCMRACLVVILKFGWAPTFAFSLVAITTSIGIKNPENSGKRFGSSSGEKVKSKVSS